MRGSRMGAAAAPTPAAYAVGCGDGCTSTCTPSCVTPCKRRSKSARGSGPITAIPKALELAGRKIEDVALFEINEAFAAQAVACARELKLDEEIVNEQLEGRGFDVPSYVPAQHAEAAKKVEPNEEDQLKNLMQI